MNCSGEAQSNPYRVLRARLDAHPLSHVGPRLITGIADDDPSRITTYPQAGVQFGPGMLWTMLFTFPLMAAVQFVYVNIGRITDKRSVVSIKSAFPPIVLRTVVLLLLIANASNIATDAAAMGEVAEPISDIDRHDATALVMLGTLALRIFAPYHRYVLFPKWLTASLLAYAAVLFTVHVSWSCVVLCTVQPSMRLGASVASTIVAVFGTAISPYLFFRQTSEGVGDMRAHPSLKADGAKARIEFRRIRWDTWGDMPYPNVAAYLITLATGVTLHVSGVANITAAAQAASALWLLAEDSAYVLFTVEILGVGLIGVPVLAGPGAYALSEAMGWKEGLECGVGDARGFYSIIAFSVLAGLVIQCSPIRPMKALLWSMIINGVVAALLMAVTILLVPRPMMMGLYAASRPLIVLGWSATAVVGITATVMFLL